MPSLFRRSINKWANRNTNPASFYFDRARSGVYGSSRQFSFGFSSLASPKNQLVALLVAASLAISGVAAAVAITIYGNNSTVAGQLSLGVGQAVATTCTQNTAVHTDTVGTYVDTLTDFVLQQVNVTQVDPNCGGKLMNLVVRLNATSSLSLNCQLPASTNFSGATTNFSLATFAFTTSSLTSSGLLYSCSSGVAYPVNLASIAATALQIK